MGRRCRLEWCPGVFVLQLRPPSTPRCYGARKSSTHCTQALERMCERLDAHLQAALKEHDEIRACECGQLALCAAPSLACRPPLCKHQAVCGCLP